MRGPYLGQTGFSLGLAVRFLVQKKRNGLFRLAAQRPFRQHQDYANLLKRRLGIMPRARSRRDVRLEGSAPRNPRP